MYYAMAGQSVVAGAMRDGKAYRGQSNAERQGVQGDKQSGANDNREAMREGNKQLSGATGNRVAAIRGQITIGRQQRQAGSNELEEELSRNGY
jgi:hypothetical protein